MSDAFFDKFIADLVKGASSNLRENGGPGVNIVVDRENRGYEEKLAGLRKLGFFTMSDPKQVAAQLLHGGGAAIRPGRATPPPIPAAAMKKGPPPVPMAAKAAYDAGAHAAMARLGVKEAFIGAALGMLGSLGGGMAARKLLPKATGMLGHAAEMGGQMLGGAAASRLAPQQPQGAVPPPMS